VSSSIVPDERNVPTNRIVLHCGTDAQVTQVTKNGAIVSGTAKSLPEELEGKPSL
jgi:hypothetical protein